MAGVISAHLCCLIRVVKTCAILLFNKTLDSSYCVHLTGLVIENVLLEFHDYTNLVGGERNCYFSAYDTLKGLPAFLKLNLLLKAVAAIFLK